MEGTFHLEEKFLRLCVCVCVCWGGGGEGGRMCYMGKNRFWLTPVKDISFVKQLCIDSIKHFHAQCIILVLGIYIFNV